MPIFENSIEAFRAFTSLLFDVLFYSWLVPVIEYFTYGLLLALEPITKIVPYLPQLDLPSWTRDAALVSAILLRAQTNAMNYADPLTTLEMNDKEEHEWKAAQEEMPLAIKMAVRFLWYVVLALYFSTKFITSPFKWIKIFRIKETINLLVGGGLMLGIAYFLHDGVLVSASTGLETRHSQAHRAFMKTLVISLVAAFFASLAFFFGQWVFCTLLNMLFLKIIMQLTMPYTRTSNSSLRYEFTACDGWRYCAVTQTFWRGV